MSTVRLSPAAEEDIEQIGDYITLDSPARAVTFVDDLTAACLAIGQVPEGFPLQPALGSDIRRAVHKRYLIFYTLQLYGVRIERVLHGARNIGEGDFI